jgi:hypothetical protein
MKVLNIVPFASKLGGSSKAPNCTSTIAFNAYLENCFFFEQNPSQHQVQV